MLSLGFFFILVEEYVQFSFVCQSITCAVGKNVIERLHYLSYTIILCPQPFAHIFNDSRACL